MEAHFACPDGPLTVIKLPLNKPGDCDPTIPPSTTGPIKHFFAVARAHALHTLFQSHLSVGDYQVVCLSSIMGITKRSNLLAMFRIAKCDCRLGKHAERVIDLFSSSKLLALGALR